MAQCPKCGQETADRQKVCVRCGALMPVSGFIYVEEAEKWRPSKRFKIIAAALCALLVVFIVYKALQVPPPDQVAMEWFDRMSQRRVADAQKYITQNFQDQLEEQMSDLRDVSEQYYAAVNSDRATPCASEPMFDDEAAPTQSTVIIALNTPDGQTQRQISLYLVKDGRKWVIDRMN